MKGIAYCAVSADGIATTYEGCSTNYELFNYSVEKFGDKA